MITSSSLSPILVIVLAYASDFANEPLRCVALHRTLRCVSRPMNCFVSGDNEPIQSFFAVAVADEEGEDEAAGGPFLGRRFGCDMTVVQDTFQASSAF